MSWCNPNDTNISNMGKWKCNRSAKNTLHTTDNLNQHITFFLLPTGCQVATELHCFRLSPHALYISNGWSRNILPLRHADGQNMQTMLRRLTVSVHFKCADRFPGQSWCVDFLTGLHFCTEWWIAWQYFRWRHKQTNIEITIAFLLITLWCCLCYWVGI